MTADLTVAQMVPPWAVSTAHLSAAWMDTHLADPMVPTMAASKVGMMADSMVVWMVALLAGSMVH